MSALINTRGVCIHPKYSYPFLVPCHKTKQIFFTGTVVSALSEKGSDGNDDNDRSNTSGMFL